VHFLPILLREPAFGRVKEELCCMRRHAIPTSARGKGKFWSVNTRDWGVPLHQVSLGI
jgi:hypothetical protein